MACFIYILLAVGLAATATTTVLGQRSALAMSLTMGRVLVTCPKQVYASNNEAL